MGVFTPKLLIIINKQAKTRLFIIQNHKNVQKLIH